MTGALNIWNVGEPAKLLASRNRKTGTLRFPPYPANSPLSAEHEVVALEAGGVVYSFSVIHPNPKSGTKPFALGYVDMPGPVRIFGRIRGETAAIGAACEAVPDPEFGYVINLIES